MKFPLQYEQDCRIFEYDLGQNNVSSSRMITVDFLW
jgi:hypothetical protein